MLREKYIRLLERALARAENGTSKKHAASDVWTKFSCERIRSFVKGLIVACDPEESEYLLQYVISVVLREACSVPEFRFVWNQPTETLSEYSIFPNDPVISEFQEKFELFPFQFYDDAGNVLNLMKDICEKVSLTDAYIYAQPGDKDKMRRALLFFRNTPFDHGKPHECRFVPELNLCYVINGVHSILGAKFNRQGTVLARICRIEPLFPHVKTDGVEWFNAHTGDRISHVYDFRIAAAYTLAQMRWELKNEETAD